MASGRDIGEQLTLAEVAALPAWLTAQQAATVLGTTRKVVIEGCNRKLWTCVQLPTYDGRWRINTASLLRYCGLDHDVAQVRSLLGLPEGSSYQVGRVVVGMGAKVAKILPADGRAQGPGSESVGARALRGYPEVLEVGQVAEISHKSIETVRRWARAGKIPCTKSGSTWLFSKRSVAEFLGIEAGVGMAAGEGRRGLTKGGM